jgi:excisionase family DNA binding protein
MPEEFEELDTVPEFAKLTRVSSATVRGWAYTGIIPCLRIGYVVRIPRKRAMKALEERTNKELAALERV